LQRDLGTGASKDEFHDVDEMDQDDEDDDLDGEDDTDDTAARWGGPSR
jgi:hypothetical protein